MKSKVLWTATGALLLIAVACGQPQDAHAPSESPSGVSAPTPKAHFTMSAFTGWAPITVRFTNDSKHASVYLWDFGDGATSTESDPSHTYTRAGIFPIELTAFDQPDQDAQSNKFTQSLILYQGIITSLAIEPDDLTLTPTQTRRFSVAAYDQFGREFPDLDFAWSTTGGGSIDSTGLLTAGARTGSFPHSVKVEATLGGVTRIATASVEIEPGPLDHVVLEPPFVELDIGGSQSFEAAGFDRFGNEIEGLSLEWWVAQGAGHIDATGAFTAGTRAGTFTVATRAADSRVSKGIAAALVVRPDPLSRVVLVPDPARLAAGGAHQFTATALDRYGNEIADVAFSWDASEPSGLIDDKGNFHASTKAGRYPAALRVQAVQGDRRREASATVTLEPGALAQLSVHPAAVELAIGESVRFTVSPLDEYGNEIAGLPISYRWPEAAGSSRLGPSGQFIAGTTAASFPIVIAARQGDVERVALTAVTIHPGSMERVVVEPTTATLEIGATQQFVFKALDGYSNEIDSLLASWSADPEAGSVDSSGMFTAAARAGTYTGGVRVAVTYGDVTHEGVAEVRLTPGPPSTALVPPTRKETGTGDGL